LGARASRPPLSASGRKHSPLNAVGGTPTAATGTVALPNPKRTVTHGKFMGSFIESLFTDKLLFFAAGKGGALEHKTFSKPF
jgi:hypothetical protein